jgi:hypothetical protein
MATFSHTGLTVLGTGTEGRIAIASMRTPWVRRHCARGPDGFCDQRPCSTSIASKSRNLVGKSVGVSGLVPYLSVRRGRPGGRPADEA